MKNQPAIFLGAALLATLSFGPHPKQFGVDYPRSHFIVGPPIYAYKIRQADHLILSFYGAETPPPSPPAPEDQSRSQTSPLEAELGPIDYSIPLSAWLPFYQSGVIEAKVPVSFTRDGKKVGTYPNGQEIQADHLTVWIKVNRFGLVPLGPFDSQIEYVALEGAKEGIALRIRHGNYEVVMAENRAKASR